MFYTLSFSNQDFSFKQKIIYFIKSILLHILLVIFSAIIIHTVDSVILKFGFPSILESSKEGKNRIYQYGF